MGWLDVVAAGVNLGSSFVGYGATVKAGNQQLQLQRMNNTSGLALFGLQKEQSEAAAAAQQDTVLLIGMLAIAGVILFFVMRRFLKTKTG